MAKMSMEEQEQSHGIDEDHQHPNYNMPRKLKQFAAAEDNLRERLRRESLNYSQQLQKVPPVLRLENESNDYNPMMVALGPYHHGKKKLRPAENFKVKALQHIIVDSGKSVQFFLDKIFERVSKVRRFYTEASTKGLNDSRFAQMMLLDACFIISHILAPTKPRFASTILSDLGHMDFAIINRDLFLLENQIPLWFLRLVMHVGYGSKAKDLVDVFIYRFSDFSKSKRKKIASYNPDIHLLDACRRVLLSECYEFERSVHPWRTYVSLMTRWIKEKYDDIYTWKREKYDDRSNGEQEEQEKYDELSTGEQEEQEQYDDDSTGEQEDQEKYDDDSTGEQHVPCFHSASDLIAKGIHFRPCRDYSLTGLCFKSGYSYAQLQLPILHVSTHNKVFFSNLIAYESCLKSPERKVTAYIKFMKSLIVHADDAKELREQGILFTSLCSDEEVVKMFKELNTSTLSTEGALENVRVEIHKHFSSKFKLWLGEFLFTYFRSPWTAIGTIAAIILLLLTLAQTYFTIRGS